MELQGRWPVRGVSAMLGTRCARLPVLRGSLGRPARRPLPAIPHAPGYLHDFHSMVRSCKIICKTTPPRPVRVPAEPSPAGGGGHWPCQFPCFAFLTWVCTAFAWFCILHERTPRVYSPMPCLCLFTSCCFWDVADCVWLWATPVPCPRVTLATPFPSR